MQLSERIVRITLIEAAGKAFGPDVVEIHQLSPEIQMEQMSDYLIVYHNICNTVRHLITFFFGYLQYLEYCVQVQASNNTPEDV